MEAVWNLNNGVHQLLWPGEFPQLPGGSLTFPAFSIQSVSLVRFLEAVHSVLSGLAGIIAFYMCIFLSLLMEAGGEFIILQSCHGLGPLHSNSDAEAYEWSFNLHTSIITWSFTGLLIELYVKSGHA